MDISQTVEKDQKQAEEQKFFAVRFTGGAFDIFLFLIAFVIYAQIAYSDHLNPIVGNIFGRYIQNYVYPFIQIAVIYLGRVFFIQALTEYFTKSIKVENLGNFSFKSRAKGLYSIALAYIFFESSPFWLAIFMYGMTNSKSSAALGFFMGLLFWCLVYPVVFIRLAKWISHNVEFEGHRFGFNGNYRDVLKWSVLSTLLLFTVVGIPYGTYLRYQNIYCKNILHPRYRIRFNKLGIDYIFRLFGWIFSIFFIIPAPWTTKWYISWFASQFVVESKEKEESNEVSAVKPYVERKTENKTFLSKDKLVYAQSLDVKKEKPSLIKPLILTTAIFCVAMLFFILKTNVQNTKKANELFAEAKDLIMSDDFDGALGKLDGAIRYKSRGEYYYVKSLILKKLKQPYKAELNLDKAIELDKSNAAYYNESSRLSNELGEVDKALVRAEKASQLQPGNSDYKYNYGKSLIAKNQRDEAIKVLHEIIEKDPNYFYAYDTLAREYVEKKDVNKSLEIRKKAAEQFPDNGSHYYYLALTYEILNMKEEAIYAYRKSIELDPNQKTDAYDRLASLSGSSYYGLGYGVNSQVETVDQVPALFYNDRIYISADIVGKRGIFLLDTGASDSVVYSMFLEENRIPVNGNGITTQYQVASGDVIQAPVYYADFTLGMTNIRNVRTAVLPNPEKDVTDGIVGQNVFMNLKIEIDNVGMALILKR